MAESDGNTSFGMPFGGRFLLDQRFKKPCTHYQYIGVACCSYVFSCIFTPTTSLKASLKADLREKQQQEEWFRSFLSQALPVNFGWFWTSLLGLFAVAYIPAPFFVDGVFCFLLLVIFGPEKPFTKPIKMECKKESR